MLDFLSTFLVIATGVYAFYLQRKVAKNATSDSPLTTTEKIQVIATLLLNPLISFAIYYYGWKDKLPQKAKMVKTYLFRIIIALLLIAIISFLLAIFFITVKPIKKIKNITLGNQSTVQNTSSKAYFYL